ncbi:hypothetical protein D3C79_935310 [compost metagenome]
MYQPSVDGIYACIAQLRGYHASRENLTNPCVQILFHRQRCNVVFAGSIERLEQFVSPVATNSDGLHNRCAQRR